MDAVPASGARGKAPKKVLAEKVSGSVKWFNVKKRYGFILRHDTQEEVFVHQTAIARNNPHKYQPSLGDGEPVEFDVVQGERGAQAANVTGPAGAPVKGSRYVANQPGLLRGYCYYRRQQPRSAGAVEDDDVFAGPSAREDLPEAQGPRGRLTSRTQSQWLRRFSPFRHQSATSTPTATPPGPSPPAVAAAAAAPQPEGAPASGGPGPSSLLSRPRGRGPAPALKSSAEVSGEPEEEKKGSRSSESARPQQGALPRHACRTFYRRQRPQQQEPAEQGQKSGGAESEIAAGPAGKPAGSPTGGTENHSASGADDGVAKAPSASRAR